MEPRFCECVSLLIDAIAWHCQQAGIDACEAPKAGGRSSMIRWTTPRKRILWTGIVETDAISGRAVKHLRNVGGMASIGLSAHTSPIRYGLSYSRVTRCGNGSPLPTNKRRSCWAGRFRASKQEENLGSHTPSDDQKIG